MRHTLSGWLQLLASPEFWWQFVVIALAAGIAVLIRGMLQHVGFGTEASEGGNRLRRMSRKALNRIQLPLTMLMVILIGKPILQSLGQDTRLLDLAAPLLLSLAAIRIAVYLLRKSFSQSPLVKAFENLISTTIWIMVALHLLGWLPPVLNALNDLAFRFGSSRISLLLVLKLMVTIALFWVLALWLARIIEQRLRRSVHVSESSRVALTKFSKFLLFGVAILVALNAAGIDLTALTVFGGAVGVGLGFGLQRITSNFISGFILLFDRSIKPGDVITIGDKFGWVQELRARYIVVRDRNGVETLIPNENLVTSEVINWSYTDKAVRLKLPVQISYGDDPEKAMQVMLQSAFASPRVLREPEPKCLLMEFADSGIQLELRIWIQDPENGLGGVQSDVNLAIWRGFKQAGITIPFPQRDIHIKGETASPRIESRESSPDAG